MILSEQNNSLVGVFHGTPAIIRMHSYLDRLLNWVKLRIFIGLNFVQNAQILRRRNKPRVKRLVQIHCSCRRLKKADRANTIIMLGMQVKTDVFSNPCGNTVCFWPI